MRNKVKGSVSNAKFETDPLCLIKGIGRFEEEATFSDPKFSLRLGHARGLTVHRTVIQYPRAATLRIYIRREEGNGGRKRPLNQRNPKDFYLKLSHLWFFAVFEMVF